MSARSFLAVVLWLLASLAVAANSVEAQQPPRLDRRVVDQTGTLSAGDIERVESALSGVEQAANVQVFSLVLRTTGATPAPQFAEDVARANGLGGNDALILVALDDRRDAIWVGPSLTGVSDDEIDAVLTERIEPRLRAAAWADAMIEGARGLGDAQRGTVGPAQQDPPGERGSAGGLIRLLIPLAAVALGSWLVWTSVARRRRSATQAGTQAAERLRPVEDLSREANTLLVETDEDVRQNEQELAFAEAQFGTTEVEPFRQVLKDARQSLRQAFAVRQRLDDSEPEAEPERRQMLEEIIARCTQAESLMEGQREHFQQLRNIERDAPQLLEELPATADALETRIPAAESQLDQVETEAPTSAHAVAGNVAEVRKRLASVRELVDTGNAALAQEDRRTAAASVRAAQEALAQATALLDAIAQLASQLDEARSRRASLRADVATDVAAAQELLEQLPDSTLRERLAAVEAALERAPSGDLVAEYRHLREADSAANALVAAVTEGVERRKRQLSALQHALRNAELRVDRAAAYIDGRRPGVGRIPRTRLSEAERQLDRARALADSEPAAALDFANRANGLAEEAYELARDEFGDFDQRQGGAWGDPRSVLIGAVLGQIFSGGGGGRGGGFGPGGGGGRSFGGGFGGGGGRSRGGAW